MQQREPRNTPEYGILESYAHDYEKEDVLTDFTKGHVEEIRRDNPDVWAVAKTDFELYKFW